MDNKMPKLSKSLSKIVWEFGPKGLSGECCEDLSMPEFLALEKVVTTPHCPVQEIGFTLGFTKSGATRVINRLEKKGYVQKVKSCEDARVCCIVVTKSGESAFAQINKTYSEKIEGVLNQLPEESAKQVRESLLILASALN